jgi:hypothetical protein
MYFCPSLSDEAGYVVCLAFWMFSETEYEAKGKVSVFLPGTSMTLSPLSTI